MSTIWLNYHHLYYFKVIATEGSIAKASKVLRLGQPTLSAQLKQLEGVLGHELFERKNRSLLLTDAGRVALEYANGIFRLGGELIEAINERPIHGKIPFHVGINDTIPKHVSIQLVEQAKEIMDCIITIHEGKSGALIRELKDHRLDLVLMNTPPPVLDTTDVKSRKVTRVPVVICGARKFQGLRKGFPESLDGKPMIFPTEDSQLCHSVETWLALKDIKVDIIAIAQDTSLQKLMASHGMGLIAVATTAVDELVHDKELFVIGQLQGVYEEYWLVNANRKIQHPLTVKLMKSCVITHQADT